MEKDFEGKFARSKMISESRRLVRAGVTGLDDLVPELVL